MITYETQISSRAKLDTIVTICASKCSALNILFYSHECIKTMKSGLSPLVTDQRDKRATGDGDWSNIGGHLPSLING